MKAPRAPIGGKGRGAARHPKVRPHSLCLTIRIVGMFQKNDAYNSEIRQVLGFSEEYITEERRGCVIRKLRFYRWRL